MSDFNTYNKFENIDNIEIKIAQYLFQNNDDIFKLLFHTTPNALDLSITFEQKQGIMPIPTGKGYDDNTRIFMFQYIDDAEERQVAQLRIYVPSISADSFVVGKGQIGFDVIVHNDIVGLNNFQTRHKRLMREVMTTLNGEAIEGLGELRFVRGNNIRLVRYNNKYSGYSFNMTQFMV